MANLKTQLVRATFDRSTFGNGNSMRSFLFLVAVAIPLAWNPFHALAQQEPSQQPLVQQKKATPKPKVSYRFLEDPIRFRTSMNRGVAVPELDEDALQSESYQTKISAFQVVLVRHLHGAKTPEGVLERIIAELGKPNPPELVRVLVSLATKLNLRQCEAKLVELADSDSLMAGAIDPTLCKWNPSLMLDRWRKQLQRTDLSEHFQRRAIKGLGECGQSDDLVLLENRLANESSRILRLEAAEAMGKLRAEGLEKLAEKYQAMGSSKLQGLGDSIAVLLLAKHRSQEAQEILAKIARSGREQDGANALLKLIDIAPEIALPIAREKIADPDSNIRGAAIQGIASLGDETDIDALVARLADPVLLNREVAAVRLIALTRKNLEADSDSAVAKSLLERVRAVLHSEKWQGIEQAILVLADLDRKEVVSEVIPLLDHPRPDVFVTAAWGLRKLVTSPSDLEAMHAKTKEFLTSVAEENRATPVTEDDYHRIAHLIELFGEQRYVPANEMLCVYIPMNAPAPIHLRCSAIWGLGRIHESQPDCPELAPIVDRMMDFMDLSPENIWVRTVCCFAVGRIGNPESLTQFAQLREGDETPVGQGRIWATERLKSLKP